MNRKATKIQNQNSICTERAIVLSESAIWPRLMLVLVFGWAFLWLGVTSADALQRKAAVAELTVEEDENEENTLEAGNKYPGGAPLKTDPDLDARLDKAKQFRDDGNFRIASRLWQSVLAESGDNLYTDDKESYYSMTQRVESILAELPPNGLSAYRIAADANARELLAQSKNATDIDILAQVVKSYFISSEGDDAAYKLGCILLDRYDFVGAVRLFRKITDQYPDPSVPLDQVWIRIAVSYAYIGDRAGAENAIDKALEAGLSDDSPLLEGVREILESAPSFNTGNVSVEWNSRFGGSRRMGIMPNLPEGYDSQNLKADWQYFFKPMDRYIKLDHKGETLTSFNPEADVSSSESSLIKSWRERFWRPAGTLLFTEDRVVFRTGSGLTVWDHKDAAPEKPVWRPLWLNQFAIDEASEKWKALYENQPRRSTGSASRKKILPSSTKETQLFGDMIAQATSIHRGVVYSIEGKEYSWNDSSSGGTRSRSNQRNYYNVTAPRRTRTNRLAAYNVNDGKLMWRLPTPALLKVAKKDYDEKARLAAENDEEIDPFEDIGFMDAPVGFGDLLLVPVNVSGSIWVYGLDSRNEGKLVWKSYLCDEPSGGSRPWSPIRIAIDGSTAYATCGTGVIFAFDPMTGGIQYARRYTRSGKETRFNNRYRGNMEEILELDGWDEDVVIPIGNMLIMMASDYNVVWAIDRQTGKFQWKTENRPFGNKFEYLIGIQDDYIYLGGSGAVAAISMKAQGRWEWVYDLGDESSYGRAMMTTDGIYLPVEDRIVKLALKDPEGQGKVLSEMNVRLGLKAPVGNLYSDGQKIWVLGANRLYTLGPDDGSIQPEPKKEAEEPEDDDQKKDNSKKKKGEKSSAGSKQ